MKSSRYKTVDEYIELQEPVQKALLIKLRACIKKAAPKAEEYIGYNMPAYKLDGPLAYFAAYKAHIGFYPTSSPLVQFKKELGAYKHSKGAVQFTLDKKLPLALITKMVKYRAQQIVEKNSTKKTKGIRKTCEKGHQFYKSSSCPTCPICEKLKKDTSGFMSGLSAPAQRALKNEGIKSVKQLSKYSEKEILKLHGIGKTAIPVLKKELKKEKLNFKS